MRIELREMTNADIEGVARVRVAGWRYAYRELLPREFLDGMRPELFAARLRAALPGEPADRVHLVAHLRGTGVIGWAHPGAYRPDEHIDKAEEEEAAEEAGPDGAGRGPGWGELHALYLLPDYLGTGIGRALMRESTRWLAARGHRRMRLWVLSGNAAGRRFYSRAGLVPDGAERTDVIGGTPVLELRYARALEAPGPG